MHGGRIEVSSKGPGRGSTFTIRLPASPGAPQAWTATATRAHGIGCRVVVIDDNRDAATTMAMPIEKPGGECRTAYDGTSGLADVLAADTRHGRVLSEPLGYQHGAWGHALRSRNAEVSVGPGPAQRVRMEWRRGII